ncbi:MAG TPA: proton-conducting transporter membrane subunit [Pelolinea sp.]|nr:proton-conducting transporter membrane subunit [Pelolinea sp.]
MVTLPYLYPAIPLLLLGGASIGIFLTARLFRTSNRIMAALSAMLFLLVGLFLIFENRLITFAAAFSNPSAFLISRQISMNAFNPSDPGAKTISVLAVGLAIVVSIFSGEYLHLDRRQHVFYPLLFLMICGFVGMLFATNLMVLYLFCELMSICAYSLVAFRRQTDTAIEAGFKYLMMGSVASIVILTGILFLFLEYGSIDIGDMQTSSGWISLLGALMFFAGFCLKSALVPLHTWLPDAHGRAPSSISAILSGILVQGVLYVLIKNSLAIGLNAHLLGTLLIFLSLLNILVGNLMGLVQKHTKRLLGYSTIAQMGYITLCMAIGLRTNSVTAIQAGFFIIVAHAVAKALAFLAKGVFHYYVGASEIKDLSRASELPLFPSISFGLAIISLSALPPFPGFTGKWFALSSFFSFSEPVSIVSALVFLAGSLIAFGYYFPLLIQVFIKSTSHIGRKRATSRKMKMSLWITIPLSMLSAAILYISLSPQFVLNLSSEAARYLMGFMR